MVVGPSPERCMELPRRLTLLILSASFGLLIGACIAVGPVASPETKVHRIGYLGFGPTANYDAFVHALQVLGYTQGKNVAVDYRAAVGHEERLPELVGELIDLRVDVLVVAGTQAIRAAQQKTKTIPIVMAVSDDALASGFVNSLARPGGNITGTTVLQAALTAKRIELMREILPHLDHLAVIANPTNSVNVQVVQAFESTAPALGIETSAFFVERPDDIAGAFDAATRSGADAVMVASDALMVNERGRVVRQAAAAQLPALYEVREFAEAGGFMVYGPNLATLHSQAAAYVDKILKGRKPADLPVEQPTRFDLVLNLRAAGILGLTIPHSVLNEATEVIR